jgi:thiamine monophosphate synthase
MFSVNYKWVFEKEKEKKNERKWPRLCVKWAKFVAPKISDYTQVAIALQAHTVHLSEQSQAQP